MLDKLIKNLEELKTLENYDGNKLIYSLWHLTSQLLYFYKEIAKGGDASEVIYRRKVMDYEHRLIYINIGRGFAKELCDGHWCYVVKDMGAKLLVVPTTSIKPDSDLDEDFYYVITSKNRKHRKFVSRMSLTDIRTVDVQRVDLRKEIRKVTTDRTLIVEHIKSKLF